MTLEDAAPVSVPSAAPATPDVPVAVVPMFTPYQKVVVAIVTFLQFTIILDFMILSPLGALLLRDLNIPTSKFGLVVSAYAFSAAISGILAAGFADRFDRKKLLLFFYTGFVGGTLLCGLATSYHFLLVARVVTGVFGGVIGSIVMAIIADLFPLNMRGRVMGFVQTAFGASQVLGLPLGMVLATRWSWHAPFFLIVGISAVAGIFMVLKLKPIDEHLKLQREGNALVHLFRTVSQRRYLIAFATTTLLASGGFMLMPFGSAFTVNNIGITVDHLWIIYLATGILTLIAGPFLGRLSDKVGKYRMFVMGTSLTIVMVLIYTHLGRTGLPLVIAINALLFIGVTSRMISASALMSAVPSPAERGAFMSVNSSLQQFAGGIAAAIAGVIVVQSPTGHIARYDILGYVVIGAMLVVVFMLRFIHRMVAVPGRP